MANEVAVPAIKTYMTKYKSKITAALPKGSMLTTERITSIVLQETQKNKALLKCNPLTLFGAVVQCAQLGLEPGGVMRQAYLIPYKESCQLIIGYAGMITLANRSGEVSSLVPRAVFEGDEFSYELGLNEHLTHLPKSSEKTADKLTHVYAVATLKDGRKVFDVMTRDEVNSIRSRSKSGGNGPWVTDYIPMAMKTAIRRLFKYLPISAENQAAIHLDELADAGIDQQLDTVLDGEFEDITETKEPQAAAQPKGNANRARAAAKQAAEPEPVAVVEPDSEPEPDTKDSLISELSVARTDDDIGFVLSRVANIPVADHPAVMEAADKAADKLRG